ncbi:MAG TPA: hypothetical protein VJT75_08360 [Thermoleophilaceae bacterium]|nr:hypothetical protein [Thermoleophilaceae bacterium]
MTEEDPTTQELRLEQLQREADERERTGASLDDAEADQHERRADKAGYLREKLEERAEAERAAETDDGRTDGAPREG